MVTLNIRKIALSSTQYKRNCAISKTDWFRSNERKKKQKKQQQNRKEKTKKKLDCFIPRKRYKYERERGEKRTHNNRKS